MSSPALVQWIAGRLQTGWRAAWLRWRKAASSASAVLLVLTLADVPRADTLRTGAGEPETTAEARWAAMSNEDTFYRQPVLLERELAGVKPGRKGRVELYFLGLAGDASQDVFMREVHYVERLLDRRFGTQGHSIVLINNPDTVEDSPIASTTSLRRALLRIGREMDPEEDVLFLFLTSHGTEDHQLWLDFWPLALKELEPASLRRMLDDAGIQRRIIVVSACYSGGFVDSLRSDDSLIITAAAADKASFGCSNEADFTYFGRAYFAEGLSRTDSFIEAFELAKPLIAQRERADHYASSNPQISIGRNMPDILRQLQDAAVAPAGRAALDAR